MTILESTPGGAVSRVAVGGSLGNATIGQGTNAVAMGDQTNALGANGTAVGGGAYAAGANDTALGGNAVVKADGSTAVGANTSIAQTVNASDNAKRTRPTPAQVRKMLVQTSTAFPVPPRYVSVPVSPTPPRSRGHQAHRAVVMRPPPLRSACNRSGGCSGVESAL